eukprot:1999607-Pyramimonas_sp.AAC.1
MTPPDGQKGRLQDGPRKPRSGPLEPNAATFLSAGPGGPQHALEGATSWAQRANVAEDRSSRQLNT